MDYTNPPGNGIVKNAYTNVPLATLCFLVASTTTMVLILSDVYLWPIHWGAVFLGIYCAFAHR